LNSTAALSLTADGKVVVNGNDAAVKFHVNGDVAFAEQFVVPPIGPGNATVDASGVSNITIACDPGGASVTDIIGGSTGKILYLYNRSGNLTLKNDAGTTATNGVITMTGGDITTVGEGMIVLLYSSNYGGRWLVTSFNP
jgi:hypothetical protein